MKVLTTKNIQEIMNRQMITRYTLSKKTNTTFHAINKIYSGESTRISLDVLESLCKALHCTPNDIFESDDPELKQRLEEYQKIISEAKERPK